jgi:DNA-binding NarL/FixJ family response regulator
MKILLLCDDLMSRTRIESAWKNAGATLLRRHDAGVPDLVVVDLISRDAVAEIARLHAARPAVPVLAFGPHVDGEAFRQAKAAGADECVARGAVVDRVLGKLKRTGA